MNGSTSSAPPFNARRQHRPADSAIPERFQQASANVIPKQEQSRTEPYLNSNAGMPYTTGYSGDWRLHPSAYEERLAKRRWSLSRWLLVIAVFIMGATVGVASAWWLTRQANVPHMPAISAPAIHSDDLPAGPQRSSKTAARGISPSELPYDGAPPPRGAEQNVPSQLSKDMANSHAPSSSLHHDEAAFGNSTPLSERASGSAEESDNVLQSDKPLAEEEVADKDFAEKPAMEKPIEEKSTAEKSTAEKLDANKRQLASEKSESTPVKSSAITNAQTGTKEGAAKPVSKRRLVTIKKDREIERIKRQADEELRKKSEFRRSAGAGSNKSGMTTERDIASSSKVSAMRVMLAKCDRTSNIIRREQCKWRLCDGMWGKNGCPSYAHPKKTIYSH